MVEYAAVIDPLWLETAGIVATGRVMIGNGYDHSELTDVTVEVARQDLDGSWNRSVHHLPDLMQKETRMIPVPTARSGEMVEVTVRTTVVCGNRRTLRHRTDAWAGPQQVPPYPGVRRPCGIPNFLQNLTATAWRAPTDNDSGFFEPARERHGVDPSVDWHGWSGTRQQDQDPLHGAGVVIPTVRRWLDHALDSTRPELAVQCTEQTDGWVEASIQLELSSVVDPARLGVVLPIQLDPQRDVEWTGDGPGESAPDAAHGVRFDTWTSAPSNLFTRYPFPQSTGTRGDLRRLSIPVVEEPGADSRMEVEVLGVCLDTVPQPDGPWWSLLP